jgi:hypothetical protein
LKVSAGTFCTALLNQRRINVASAKRQRSHFDKRRGGPLHYAAPWIDLR